MPSIYTDSGKILGFVTFVSNDQQLRQSMLTSNGAAGYVEEREDPKTRYVANGQAVDRPAMTVFYSDGILNNLPVNSTITINGTNYEATGPDVALNLAGAIEYQITVRCWPYLDWQTTISDA